MTALLLFALLFNVVLFFAQELLARRWTRLRREAEERHAESRARDLALFSAVAERIEKSVASYADARESLDRRFAKATAEARRTFGITDPPSGCKGKLS